MAISQIATRNADGTFENLFPLSIDKGGTGANTKEQALVNLGAIPLNNMAIEMKYKVLDNIRVYSGDLELLYSVFLEFGHIPHTKINFVNRMELQGTVMGPMGQVFEQDKTLLPPGAIPKQYLPSNFTEGSIGLACHVWRDTTAQGISQQYSIPITLSIHPDGSVSNNDPFTKFYDAHMAIRIYCNTQFLAANEKL